MPNTDSKIIRYMKNIYSVICIYNIYSMITYWSFKAKKDVYKLFYKQTAESGKWKENIKKEIQRQR